MGSCCVCCLVGAFSAVCMIGFGEASAAIRSA